MANGVYFERAIFLSWYCSKGDCKFCYMSTQKDLDPAKAKRDVAGVLAEVVIAKACNWKIEFISGGYDSYPIDEIVEFVRNIHDITGQKQWLNIGALSEEELKKFLPYIKGAAATLECANLELREKLCPSKPLEPIVDMLKACDKLRLKKCATLIIGLGESIEDFETFKKFIEENGISKVTFYSLNPHEGTPFEKSPEKGYYAEWIRKTRERMPELKIVAGSWCDKLEEVPLLLEAGADNITKFPALKKFGKKEAFALKEAVESTGKVFQSNLTEMPSVDWNKEVDKLGLDEKLKERIKAKLHQYLKRMPSKQ